MARYDYRCSACGLVFEVEHPMGESPEVLCPDCGGAAERVFSASAISLKGSGFYNTDMRGKDSTQATSGATTNGDSSSSTATSSEGSGGDSPAHPGSGTSAKADSAD